MLAVLACIPLSGSYLLFFRQYLPMYATVFNIQRFSVHDGPGIRSSVFMQGCPLHCAWCHNPEGIAQYNGNGQGETLPAGVMTYSPDELMEELMKDHIFYEVSGGGVTFSGGEPLLQYGFLLEMLKSLEKQNIHTAVDTSGYAPAEVFESVCRHAGLILFDLKLIGEASHSTYTGKDNSLILDNLSRLLQGNTDFRIRIPLLEGITAREDNLRQIAALLCDRGPIHIDLLPYHAFGIHKNPQAAAKAEEQGFRAPDERRIQEIRQLFGSYGHHV